MKEKNIFKYILGISAFALAGCAAFFSVKGIALLFSASFYSVLIMAGSLEMGKLISASYLYREWNNINKTFKYYMLFASILLMCITSLGIFGFLSDSFQRNFSQYSLNINKIQSSKSQQNFIVSQIDFNKNKLKDLIELQKTYQNSLDNAVKQDVTTTKTTGGGLFSSNKTEKVTDNKLLDSRNKIVESSQQNINTLFNQIQIVTTELQDLENKNLEKSQEILRLESDNTKGEIGTFKFVAEAFNLKIETAVKIFIIFIVIVFDPLAICLVIAFNSQNKYNKINLKNKDHNESFTKEELEPKIVGEKIEENNQTKDNKKNFYTEKEYNKIYKEYGYLKDQDPNLHKKNQSMNTRGNLHYRFR